MNTGKDLTTDELNDVVACLGYVMQKHRGDPSWDINATVQYLIDSKINAREVKP